jgi:hypothetical protein
MSDIYTTAPTGQTLTARLYQGPAQVGPDLAMTEIGATGEYFAAVPTGTAPGQYRAIVFMGAQKVSAHTLQWAGTAPAAGGLTAAQAGQLRKVAQLHGVGAELVVTETSRTAGDVSQTIVTTPTQTSVSAA